MKKGLRRVAVAAVATLVVAPALATVASATSTFAFDRLAGSDRYATSVETAIQYGDSTNVILASGVPGHYPDALTASYLAGDLAAPIMLTQLDATPADVLAQLASSTTTDVWLIGGEGVISAAQATALAADYTVHRLGGLDRYLTSQAVMDQVGAATSTTALLATGVNFPDAIAAGPLSYVKGMPLAITGTDTLPAATLTALQDAGVTKVIALGGPTIITANVLADLAAGGITLDQRIYGADRAETSADLADYMITSQGFSNTAVNVASGYTFGEGADALSGGPLSGKENVPTLITDSNSVVGPGVTAFLTAHSATLATGHIFGGLGAVGATAAAAMTTAAQTVTVTSNQTITVTPSTPTTMTAVTYAAGTPSTYVQYTATVPAGVTAVSIQLAQPADVTTTGSTVAFTKATGFLYADFSDVTDVGGARIENYNGIDTGAGVTNIADVPVVSGQVTFRVGTASGATQGMAIPVVYEATSGYLVTDASGVPTGDFGIGGQATFNPAEADGTTPVTNATVVSSAPRVSISSATAAYYFQTGDTYQIGTSTVTTAAFDAAISAGDTVTITNYLPVGTAGAHATNYNITADKPAAPTALTAALVDTDFNGTVDKARLTFTAGMSGLQDGTTSATVQVAKVTSGIVGAFGAQTITDFTYVSTTGTITLDAIPAAGSYVYKVMIKGLVGATFSDYSANSNTLVVASAGSPSLDGAPHTLVTGGAVYQDNNTDNNVNSGDILRLSFNEPMTAPASDASFTLTDADGSAGTVTNGVNSTWVLSADKLSMAITLSGVPVVTVVGSPIGVQYGATISAPSGVTDLATNNTGGLPMDWDLTTGDKLF